MASYLDKDGLEYLWNKIKQWIPTKTSDITNDSGYVSESTVDEKLTSKVDKVTGKDLSTNDYVDLDKQKVDLLAIETHGPGELSPEGDGIYVYKSEKSRELRGYSENQNYDVERTVWFDDAGRDNTYDNIGENVQIKSPVVYNNSIISEMPTGKFLVKASTLTYENTNWPWVGIFDGHKEVTDTFSRDEMEVYCYLDAWADSGDSGRSPGGHGSLQGVEFDILTTYDGYAGHHNNYWFFPPGEYSVVIFADDSYYRPLEVCHFAVLDQAWRARAYDDDFTYNSATKKISVGQVFLQEAPTDDSDAVNKGYMDAAIPSKTSDLTNDSGFISTETDPTVPAWAKAATKPSYTAAEVGALPDSTTIPSKTSDLTNDSGFITTETDPTVPAWAKAANKPTYTASEVGAMPDTFTETDPTVPAWAKASSKPSYNFSEIGSKPTTLSGYGITDAKIANGTITLGSNTITPLTSFTETDPTVPSWAKASSKPSYTASEVGAVPTTRTVNSKALSSDITLTASDVSALATADKYTRSSAGTLDWTSSADGDAKVIMKSALAFWNGAYSETSSNLAYCKNGAIIGGSGFSRVGTNVNFAAKSVAANGGTVSVTQTFTKSGYYPVSIVGLDTSLPSGLALRRYNMTAASAGSCTCLAEYTNTTASAISVTTSHVTAFYIMWAKIS